MNKAPEWLSEYREILESVRKKLVTVPMIEEISFEYAQKRVFSRLVLSMAEIYILMLNGYPQGAMVLSRQTFEALVILDYLQKNRDDNELITRFFCDVVVSELMINKEKKLLKGESVEKENNRLKEIANEFKDYVDDGRFSPYWWVCKKCSIKKLAENTDFHKNYMYMVASKHTHISSFSSIVYCGENDSEVLIGSTYDGVYQPAWFSMLNFHMAMDVFSRSIGIDLREEMKRAKDIQEMMKESK